MKLNKLTKIFNTKKKRIGRGYGSGKGGHTVGKGAKGQRSRTGYSKVKNWIRESKIVTYPKLRGIGQRKVLGKKLSKKSNYKALNIKDIEKLNPASVVDRTFLYEKGVISKEKGITVKILGEGKLTKKLTFKGIHFSKKAREIVEKAGGKIL